MTSTWAARGLTTPTPIPRGSDPGDGQDLNQTLAPLSGCYSTRLLVAAPDMVETLDRFRFSARLRSKPPSVLITVRMRRNLSSGPELAGNTRLFWRPLANLHLDCPAKGNGGVASHPNSRPHSSHVGSECSRY